MQPSDPKSADSAVDGAEAPPTGGGEGKRRAAYEPPRLVRIGNVRDVVGKSGFGVDNPRPHPRRP